MKLFFLKVTFIIAFLFYVFQLSSQPCSSIQSMTLSTLYTLTNLPTTGNDWSNYTGCAWNEPGDEFVFSFTAPADGYYNFLMNQTAGNPDFFLMSACSNTSTNLLNGCWDYGTTTLYLTAGTTVYLIVDNAGFLPASC
ncbi:MAG: hypothetical protein N2Z72_08530, partial [Bacteroidales bacterium]|nr:hypothetical protein [Bacteroidales bacterium]